MVLDKDFHSSLREVGAFLRNHRNVVDCLNRRKNNQAYLAEAKMTMIDVKNFA